MENGDISNDIPRRAWVVFEHLIAHLPDKAVKRHNVDRALRRWRRSMVNWRVNTPVRDVMFNVGWRSHLPLDVVTFLGEDVAPYLTDWLDAIGLPFSHVHCYESPAAVSKALSHHPEVMYVFHADTDNLHTYGDRGYLVSPTAPVLPL